MSLILSTLKDKTIDSIEEHTLAILKEQQHSVAVQAKEKIADILNKTASALGVAQQVSGQTTLLEPVHSVIDKATDKIKMAEKRNKEELENEKEELAWSTIERIGTKKLMKSMLAAETTVEGINAGSTLYANMPSLGISTSTTSTWPEFPESLQNIKLPSISLPNPLNLFTSTSKSTSGIGFLLPQLSLPAISLQETSLSLPQLPSLPQNSIVKTVVDIAVDKVTDKIVERAMDAEQSYLNRTLWEPTKAKLEQSKQKVAEFIGEDGTQFVEAAGVILNHQTARYQDKAKNCWDYVKSGIQNMHRKTIEAVFYYCTKPVTVE